MTTPTARWTAAVSGMTCDACERHVTNAVEAIGGRDVSASWSEGTATFNAAGIDEAALGAAVRDAGYELGEVRRTGDLQPVADGDDVEWDLAIIGSGSAAFAAAIKATEAGARVVVIEKGTPGGTCVNVGCVPSKALLVAAEAHHRGRSHAFAGVAHIAGGQPDLAAIVAQKDELVGALRQAKYLDLIDAYGFTLRHGTARFIDADTISVDDEPLRAANYLIATGARPALPPIEGLDAVDYLTSTSALELTEVPARLAVVGANAIGLELGQAFAHLGADVTFLDIAERVAPFEEPEISGALTDVLVGDGAARRHRRADQAGQSGRRRHRHDRRRPGRPGHDADRRPGAGRHGPGPEHRGAQPRLGRRGRRPARLRGGRRVPANHQHPSLGSR